MADDDARQRQYTLVWTFLIAAALLGTYLIFQDQYRHPMPAEDCSQAYDYPICARAQVPPVLPPTGAMATFLAMLFTGVAALLLLIFSYRASVTSQKDLVVSGPRATGSRALDTREAARVVPSAPSKLMAPPKEMAELPRLQETEGKDAWGHPVPKTILNNRIAPELIKPPAKRPSQGVDKEVLR